MQSEVTGATAVSLFDEITVRDSNELSLHIYGEGAASLDHVGVVGATHGGDRRQDAVLGDAGQKRLIDDRLVVDVLTDFERCVIAVFERPELCALNNVLLGEIGYLSVPFS